MFIAGLWTVTGDGSTFLPERSPKILCVTWSKCLPTPSLVVSTKPWVSLIALPQGEVSMRSKKRALQALMWLHIWRLQLGIFIPTKRTGGMLNQDTESKIFPVKQRSSEVGTPLQSFSLKEIIISRWAASDKGCSCSVSSRSLLTGYYCRPVKLKDWGFSWGELLIIQL